MTSIPNPNNSVATENQKAHETAASALPNIATIGTPLPAARSTAPDDEESPFTSSYYRSITSSLRSNNSRRNPLRRVKRVSRHAALTTKHVVWDTNDASIDAALSAVDQWEAAYNALRALMVASMSSAQGLYRAAKDGASQMEHGLFMPLRDWILLPAFGGVERAVTETNAFLHSPHAKWRG